MDHFTPRSEHDAVSYQSLVLGLARVHSSSLVHHPLIYVQALPLSVPQVIPSSGGWCNVVHQGSQGTSTIRNGSLHRGEKGICPDPINPFVLGYTPGLPALHHGLH